MPTSYLLTLLHVSTNIKEFRKDNNPNSQNLTFLAHCISDILIFLQRLFILTTGLLKGWLITIVEPVIISEILKSESNFFLNLQSDIQNKNNTFDLFTIRPFLRLLQTFNKLINKINLFFKWILCILFVCLSGGIVSSHSLQVLGPFKFSLY